MSSKLDLSALLFRISYSLVCSLHVTARWPHQFLPFGIPFVTEEFGPGFMVSSSFKTLEFLFSVSAMSAVPLDETYSLERDWKCGVQVPCFRDRESGLLLLH